MRGWGFNTLEKLKFYIGGGGGAALFPFIAWVGGAALNLKEG